MTDPSHSLAILADVSWTRRNECEGFRVGIVATPRRVSLDRKRQESILAALRRVGGDLPTAASLADYCPDPLAFALESGLPRPQMLDRLIEGASEWIEEAQVPDGPLTAVSTFTEFAAGRDKDGRGVARLTYETVFYKTGRGNRIGCARGVGFCLEEPA